MKKTFLEVFIFVKENFIKPILNISLLIVICYLALWFLFHFTPKELFVNFESDDVENIQIKSRDASLLTNLNRITINANSSAVKNGRLITKNNEKKFEIKIGADSLEIDSITYEIGTGKVSLSSITSLEISSNPREAREGIYSNQILSYGGTNSYINKLGSTENPILDMEISAYYFNIQCYEDQIFLKPLSSEMNQPIELNFNDQTISILPSEKVIFNNPRGIEIFGEKNITYARFYLEQTIMDELIKFETYDTSQVTLEQTDGLLLYNYTSQNQERKINKHPLSISQSNTDQNLLKVEISKTPYTVNGAVLINGMADKLTISGFDLKPNFLSWLYDNISAIAMMIAAAILGGSILTNRKAN